MHPRSLGWPSRMQVLALVSLGGVALFIWQQDVSAIPEAFAGANLPLVGVALALHAGGHVVRAARWRFLLAHAGECGHWAALQALTIGAAANNLLPAKVGILIRAHLVCRRTRIGHPAVASSLVLEAMLDVVVLLTLLLLAVATMGMDPALRGGAAAAAGALALMLSVGAWLSRESGATRARGGVLQRLVPGMLRRRAPAAAGAALRETGLQFRRGVHSLRQPRRATGVALTTAVSWAVAAAALVALGSAFDLGLAAWEYVGLLAALHLTVALPTVAAGLGTFEVLLVGVLTGLDVAAAQAAAFTLALHAMLVMPVTLAGLLLLWWQPERLGLGATTQRSTRPSPGGGPAPTPASRRRLIRPAFWAQRATGIAHTDSAEEAERAA